MCKDTIGQLDDLSCTWWKKRTSSFKLSSDLHTYKCTLVPACMRMLAHTHTHMQAIEETREKAKTTEIAVQGG